MTYEEFWEGDNALPIYYRKAEEIKNKKTNQLAWLQGMYFYEALCDASPILHAFAKSGTRPHPYPKMPYGNNESKAENKEDKIAKERLKAKLRFESWVNSFKQKK